MNVSSWIMDRFNKGLDVDATAAAEGYAAPWTASSPYQAEPSRISWFLGNFQRFQDDNEEQDQPQEVEKWIF